MSKTSKKSILTRIVTGTVVTACAASAIWTAGGSIAPYARVREQGITARAAVTQMLAEEQAEQSHVVGVFARTEANYINFGLAVDNGTGAGFGQHTGLDDASKYGTYFTNNILINGKNVGLWPAGFSSIHGNIGWHTNWKNTDGTDRAANAYDGATDFYDITLQTSLNMSLDNNDVFTIRSSFPICNPEVISTAIAAGETPVYETLGEDLSYRIVKQEDNTYLFVKVDSPIMVTKEESFATAEKMAAEGSDYHFGDLVETTYDGCDNEAAMTFRTDDAGNLSILNAESEAVSMTGEGWTAFDPNTQVGSQREMSFWVYSAMTQDELRVNLYQGVEVSEGSGPDDATEYQWHATDVLFNPNYREGMWNRVIMKFREPSQSQNGDQGNFDALRWFRFFYNFGAEDGSIDANGAAKGIYISDVRLIQSPAQSSVIQQAKVKQYIEPTFVKPAVGGERVEIDLGLTTRLRNTPGVDADSITLTSSDPATIKVEKDATDGKWYATALKLGSADIAASIPGDERYAAAEQTFAIEARKADQAALSITSAATGTYGTEYALASEGGSGDGAVTYEVVSGPATVSGNKLTFAKAGTVVVKALKAGNDTYEATESAEFTITVAKAKITVKIKDVSVIQDTALPPETAYSYDVTEGTLLAGDSIKLIYNASTADIAKPGDYELSATAEENDKYEITVEKGKITVTAKAGGDTDKTGGGCSCNGTIAAGSAIAGIAALAAATGILFFRKHKKGDK